MNIKPKKSLGQNFLRDEKVLRKIIQSADLKPDDFVIEIGPGEGVLTQELAKYAKKNLAVELDDNLVAKLDSRFHENDKIKIIRGDILKINLAELVDGFVETPRRGVSTADISTSVETRQCLVSTAGSGQINYKLIANIPYYITSAIIRLFLESACPPTEMILMVQKEVAERICAKPGEMSILSVSVQYYAMPELLFYVNKKSFFPEPKVDSAVIKVLCKKHKAPNKERKRFFKIIRAGFSAKRKTLVNNLANSLQLDKNIVEEKIKTVGLKPTARAQELSVEDWKRLSNLLN